MQDLDQNPSYYALTLVFHALHACTLHWYLENFIVEIIGQEYEGFMMELEDLKLCIQENIIKQVNEKIKCHDS